MAAVTVERGGRAGGTGQTVVVHDTGDREKHQANRYDGRGRTARSSWGVRSLHDVALRKLRNYSGAPGLSNGVSRRMGGP